MEKGTNKKMFVSVGKMGLVAIGLAGLYLLIKNSYKKELKALSEAKEQENKEIESLGVSSERMRSQVYDCEREVDRNMVKATYVGIESNTNPDEWNPDVINIDKVLKSQSVVHITEERGGYKGQLRYLIFLLEIPDDAMGKKGSFNRPRIGDYYIAMKQLKEYLWSREVVYLRGDPIGKMTVYLAYSYNQKTEEGGHDLITETVEIPKSFWSHWEDVHDGLVEFYQDLRDNGMAAIKKKGLIEEFQDLLTNDFAEKNPELNPSEYAIHYEDTILMYKIGFVESKTKDDGGISVKTALASLKYMANDFVVTRKGTTDKGGVKYDRFMFHAPNEDGVFDSLTRYYTTSNGKVIFDTYSYPEEEPVQESANSIRNNMTIKSDKRLNKE